LRHGHRSQGDHRAVEETLQHNQTTQLTGIQTTCTRNVRLAPGSQCLKKDKNELNIGINSGSGQTLQPVPFIQSNGSNCYDNAVTESFFHTLKTESVDQEHFQRRAEAHQHLFDYIEVFYNPKRLHSSLRYNTPMRMLQDINNKQAA
jgi:hypothetical protein